MILTQNTCIVFEDLLVQGDGLIEAPCLHIGVREAAALGESLRWSSPVMRVGSSAVCWWEVCVSAVIVRSSAVCLKSGDAGASVRYSCTTLLRSASRWWCSAGGCSSGVLRLIVRERGRRNTSGLRIASRRAFSSSARRVMVCFTDVSR